MLKDKSLMPEAVKRSSIQHKGGEASKRMAQRLAHGVSNFESHSAEGMQVDLF